MALPSRYAHAELIARGGMADIYAAEDTELGRQVAVKVLSERFAGDADVRERFKREALAAARLSGHPNIATIFDVGETENRPFIVLELMDGGSLAERIEAGSIPEAQALAWLGQAASALDAAHAEGIVHRDVKPANMLLDREGDLKITDFGIALVLDEAATAATATGTILGTAGYLAPEQAAGSRATTESDIYALGVVAYELLAGSRPFARRSVAAEAAAHMNEPVEPPSERAGLPTQADPVFARVLAKDPAYRYPSAAAFVRDLSAALEGEEVAAAPVAAAAGAAGATAVTQVAARPPRRWRRPRFLPVAGAALLAAGGGLAAVLVTHSQNSPASTPPPSQPRHTAGAHTAPAPSPVSTPVTSPPRHGKAKGHSKKPKEHGKGKRKGHTAPLTTSPGTTTAPGTTTQPGTTTSPTTTLATTTAPTTTTATTSAAATTATTTGTVP